MRASRLLSILLILQSRGHVTAQQLAEQLEVSVRTIYRDAEALQVAGIPLYGEAGPEGGYRLVDGYRTRLTGLTQGEARALFLTGLPGPAAELGFGAAMAAAQLKLAASLPSEVVESASLVRERFYLDAPGWYASDDQVPHLAGVAQAVWEQRRIHVRYRRWEEPDLVERSLEPLGIVLKAGNWYLVARHDSRPRTYRVSQILDLDVTERSFARPARFELARYWAGYLADFQDRLYRSTATIRLSPEGCDRLAALSAAAVQEAVEAGARAVGDDGWIEADIPIESLAHAQSELLKFGAEVEVVAPPELRSLMAATARALTRRYRDSASASRGGSKS